MQNTKIQITLYACMKITGSSDFLYQLKAVANLVEINGKQVCILPFIYIYEYDM